uniref:Glycosyltransferase n=1 Tax=Araucaria cunninghamii TaxID=56994 RepID=A0A0D6QUF4_ARACU
MGSQKSHIVLFPSVGMGHLIPFFEFAKSMAIDHDFSVTFIMSQWMVSPSQTAHTRRLASLGLDIRFVDLPPPDEEGDQESHHLIRVFNGTEKSTGPVKEVLRTLGNVCAFVTDLFCTAVLEASAALGIPGYILFVVSATNACLMFFHPTLDAETTESLADTDEPVDIPGLPSMPPRYFPDPMQHRADPIYGLFLRHSHRLCKANGILINTFQDLESGSIRALESGVLLPAGVAKMPDIYPIGPLIATPEETEKDECLEWLDRQPPASVIFVSFGSVGFLSVPQMRELALGLEASGHRFLWVLRKPPALAGADVAELLPPGFESRTRDRGLVVSTWVSQIPVLAHKATGGFLSHCGWNSVLESVSLGVPMIAWPLQAEQRTTAFFLTREIGVAIEVEWEADGWVAREKVERVARELMEGEGGRKVKARAAELKESARRAVEGSSKEALAAVTARWKSRATE